MCFEVANGASYATLACLAPLFKQIVFYLLLFSGIVALFMIIFSGIKMIASSGDPKQLDTARKTFGWAILGLFLIIFSFFIIRVISGVTSVECILDFGLTNCQTSGNSSSTNNSNECAGACRFGGCFSNERQTGGTCSSGSSEEKCCVPR